MKRGVIVLAIVAAALAACEEAPSDGRIGLVYEGHPVSLFRGRWHPASVPFVVPVDPLLNGARRQSAMWYNPEPALAVRLYDLYPDFDEMLRNALPGWFPEVDAGDVEQPLVALDIELFDAPQDGFWTGVMRGARGGADFSSAKALAVWVNDFKPDPSTRGGFLHVDLGRLDENFYEPEKAEWNDEDKARDGYDDTGLDGLFDEEEDSTYALGSPEDPHGDDFAPQRIDGRFLKVNGTEGNRVYDTEDLDASGQMDRTESLYRFTIPLSSAAVIDVRADHPDYNGWTGEHANDAWRLYVVDIADAVAYARTVFPDLHSVHHVRVWVEDLPAAFREDDGPGRRRIELTGLALRE